jgi:hypothetical protein
MAELFDSKPAPSIERLARIEGQSNFLSLLDGTEAGPDTTEDMAALSFARSRGVVPEVLEAHFAQSGMYKRPLLSMVFRALCAELHPHMGDYPWMQGAVADAFLILRYGRCKCAQDRAKQFRVSKEVYLVIRKAASGAFSQLLADAEREWRRARFYAGTANTPKSVL